MSGSLHFRHETVLAGHYGFTPEELDFILNYDIKYRLGREGERGQLITTEIWFHARTFIEPHLRQNVLSKKLTTRKRRQEEGIASSPSHGCNPEILSHHWDPSPQYDARHSRSC